MNIKLGDCVEFITKHTGIKWLVNKIWKGNCGCERRKEKLNNLFNKKE